MAFSSNPVVRELQNGVGFAFRPDPGRPRRRRRRASPRSSVRSPRSTASASDNGALARRERAAADRERPAPGDPARERPADRRCSSCGPGFDFKTVAATVIAREPSEFRRAVTIDEGTDDGIEVGDIVIARGRRARRAGHRVGAERRARSTLLTDVSRPSSDSSRRTPRQARWSASSAGALDMTKIDSTARSRSATRS